MYVCWGYFSRYLTLYLSTINDANTEIRKIYSLRKVKNEYVVRKYTRQIPLLYETCPLQSVTFQAHFTYGTA